MLNKILTFLKSFFYKQKEKDYEVLSETCVDGISYNSKFSYDGKIYKFIEVGDKLEKSCEKCEASYHKACYRAGNICLVFSYKPENYGWRLHNEKN